MNLLTLLSSCAVLLTLVASALSAAPELTLTGPDASGGYDLTWSTGQLEQTSVLVQSWANVGATSNSYHIVPASDLGNKFYRLHDGQTFSANIVGYVNLAVPKGFSLIANQLNASPDNTLESVIPHPPENTTIYTFNGTGYDSATFSADNPGWFPGHKVLSLGGGAFIGIDLSEAPSGAKLTFVGQVQLSSSLPVVSGCSIMSFPVPMSDSVGNLGFPVRENDTICVFRQGHYTCYNWSADNPGWFPAVPRPMVSEAFFYCNGSGLNRVWTRTFSVGPP